MKTGKKRFIGFFAAIFLLVFAAACVFGACGSKEDETTVESVSVSPTSLELTLDSSGEASGTVTATVKMSDSSNYTGDVTVGAVSGVSYSVSMSNSSATIIVTATEPVSATSVSVSAGGKSASFTLTVNAYEAGTPEPEPEPEPEDSYAVSVAAESSVTEVEVESTLQLTASVTNNGTAVEGASVTWSQASEDGGEVEFSETTSGLITGVTAGTVTITATYIPEGGEAVSGTITVTVKEAESSGTEHTHVYGSPEWKWKDDYTCTVTWTCTTEGCEEEGNVITKDAMVTSSTTAATCVTDGETVYTATYTATDGTVYTCTETKTVTIPATGHTYPASDATEGVSWNWGTDANGSVTATVIVTCTKCGSTETATADVTEGAYVAPTCTAKGSQVYGAEAVVTESVSGTTYTYEDENTVELDTVPHTYPTATQTEYFVWPSMDEVAENDTVSITVKCSVCGNDIETVTATITKIETTDATSDTNGKTVYTATAYINGNDVELSYEVTIPATGHSYPEATDTTCVVWDWENKTENTVTVTIYCKDGDEHVMETGTVTFTTEVTKEPSCTENGVLTYTASFTATGNGVTYTSTYDEDIEMTAHTAGTSTVFSEGHWYVACSVCGGACGDPLTTGEGYTFNVTTAEEIEAAATLNGAQIVLEGNITATVEISGTVSIDLSGYTLTGSGAHTITVKAGGVLTIEDTQESGVVDNITDNCAAIFVEAGGDAKLVGGTYTRSLENGDGGTYYTIVNQGTMTISSPVKVETSAATTSSMVENGWATPTDNTTGATATLTIEGGTFSGGANHLVKNDDYGKLVISGGTFTGNGVSVILNYGELEISNGTFTQESTTNNSLVIWNNDGGVAYPTITISGGTFVGGEYETLYNDSTGTMKISGGTFENSLYAVVYSAGTLEISGGTFKSTGTGLYIYVIWAGDGTIDITNGTFAAGDSSDVLVAAGGDAVVTISGGTFTGPDDATMLYTYAGQSGDEIAATITVTGGSFSAAPEGFLADGYAAIYDETAGLFVVGKAPAYVADATISDTEITLDLANGADQRDLTITVVMSEEGSDFEGHVTWTITSGSDIIEIDRNGVLSATVTTLGVTGEATITAEMDGTAFTFTVVVHVIDSAPAEASGLIVEVDFTTGFSTGSLVTTSTETDVELTYSDGTSTGFYVKGSAGEDNKTAEIASDGEKTYLSFGGGASKTTGSLSITLDEGIYVIKISYFSTGTNRWATVLDGNGNDMGTLVAYEDKTPSSDPLTREITITLETAQTIYIGSKSSGLNITYVSITKVEEAPVLTVLEVALDETEIELKSGEAIVLSAIVTLSDGKTYVGYTEAEYTWTFTGDGTVTQSGSGNNITIIGDTVGAVAVTVTVVGVENCSASCTVTVTEATEGYVFFTAENVTEKDTAIAAGGVIAENEYFTITATGNMTYSGGDSFTTGSNKPTGTLMSGESYSFTSAMATDTVSSGNTSCDVLITANTDVTLRVYINEADSGHSSNRSGGTISYTTGSAEAQSVQSTERKTVVAIDVSLSSGDTLTINATNSSSNFKLYLYGVEATTGDYNDAGGSGDLGGDDDFSGDGVRFFPPFTGNGHSNGDTTDKNNVITENDLFSITNLVKIKYNAVSTSFTDKDGNTVDVSDAISTSSSTNSDSVISVTAREDITIYLYFSVGDSSFGSAKEGSLNYSVNGETAGTVSVSGKEIVAISVSLNKGDTLTVSLSSTDKIYVWFFGAEAVLN